MDVCEPREVASFHAELYIRIYSLGKIDVDTTAD